MINLSAVIMAHPKRAHFIPILQALLDRELPVVWDECNNRWDTGRRAMLAHDPSADYHLVLQDDAIVCRDLIAGIERALNFVPHETPVSLYTGHGSYKEGLRRIEPRTSWVQLPMDWGVGIIMPVSMIKDAMAYGDRLVDIDNYDKRIGRYLRSQSIVPWHSWPSLLNHRQSPSLVPGRGYKNRVAYRFIGAERSALDVDWTGHVVRLQSRCKTVWQVTP